MRKILIQGGKSLHGTVTVSGAKNAAVAIIPAVLLSDEPCTIENLPHIDDVSVLRDILVHFGAIVEMSDDGKITIDPRPVKTHVAPNDLARKMRASYYLLSALIGRFHKAEVPFPGGCEIGSRPIDQTIKGWKALGVDVTNEYGVLTANAQQLRGTEVYLDLVSVGATVNTMLTAVKAQGTTIIVNAAKEPHIVDLANFLNNMGASVKGAGTDIIRIRGVERLHGCTYSIIPDQIETGTMMIIAAATRGDVTIQNCIPHHMEAVSAKLMEMGVEIIEGDDFVRVIAKNRPRSANVKTLVYPGFPTDLQQPITALLSTAAGTSIITETIFEARFKYVEALRRMGANIQVIDRVAFVNGVDKLKGAQVEATDLRAGAALVVAALMAEGKTEILRAKHIDRGYEDLCEKLIELGADIQRVQSPEE